MEIEAISLGLTLFSDISIPSTSTNGAESFKVPVPRIRKVDDSELGLLDVCITFNPATIPDKVEASVVTGRDKVLSSKLTVATEPVRFTFF